MSNPTASQVAAELRKLADSLDASPDAQIVRPYIFFSAYEKDEFLATARLLPHPLKKKVDDFRDANTRKIRLEYINGAIDVTASVPQIKLCELIEPAKEAVYRCHPILSVDEESSLEPDGASHD